MIFVECKPDKALVSSLGGRDVRHHEGKDKLLNKLQKEKATKAMVDEDPKASQHPYFNKLQRIEPHHDVRVSRDPKTGNMVIVLCPALEGWLLKTVREAGESMEAFGMSDNENKLRRQLTLHPENAEKVVRKILPQSERLKTLKNLLEENLK